MDIKYLVGSDEAGYGAWAGPLCVAGVRVAADWTPPLGLTDSKKLSEAQRETLWLALTRDPAFAYQVRLIPSSTIDARGIYGCLLASHNSVHDALSEGLENLRHIADGTLPLERPIESIPKADSLFPVVAAASIIAKVTRDREMVRLADQFPEYGFKQHKGYGVPAHEEALRRIGPCVLHRMSFGPLASFKPKTGGNVLEVLDGLEQE